MSLKITFHHFHEGNDKDHKVRKGAVYATQCRLVNTNTGEVIQDAWARCNKKDSPTRSKGRDISKGRLLKLIKEEVEKGGNPLLIKFLEALKK